TIYAGLIALGASAGLAAITPNPPTVSVFPGQTTAPITLDLTWATPANPAGSALVSTGPPPGVTTQPVNVTYNYAANSTSASTSFQFVVASSVVPGTYPIPLRDTSNNNAGAGSVTLIVLQPSFTATAIPNPLTLVIGGAPQNVTVNTNPDPGFGAPNITYSFTGFPAFIKVPPA